MSLNNLFLYHIAFIIIYWLIYCRNHTYAKDSSIRSFIYHQINLLQILLNIVLWDVTKLLALSSVRR